MIYMKDIYESNEKDIKEVKSMKIRFIFLKIIQFIKYIIQEKKYHIFAKINHNEKERLLFLLLKIF